MNERNNRPEDGQHPWLTSEEQRTWRDWILVSGRMDTVLARQLQAESAISLADYVVLVQLSEHPEKRERIAVLAEALQWDRSRLSHQITRMAKRGLVRRETCSNDGRGAFVAIEDHGLEVIKAAAPGHAGAVREHFFDQLDPKDVDNLGRILSKLATHLR
ncbi:MarR family winged helix-turn-helix transcriptional regulator [uncultured Corynebacterium sp.]|uniref:MarR family winged helix-turn-helix transcriptional regulator n=1 Tax=uncultured Corynebacterium sp. TaxID=159447 RepID=UPI0025939BF3|nr:MarR family transcriptional regulator [uncultured Corynebacterium sp.]